MTWLAVVAVWILLYGVYAIGHTLGYERAKRDAREKACYVPSRRVVELLARREMDELLNAAREPEDAA